MLASLSLVPTAQIFLGLSDYGTGNDNVLLSVALFQFKKEKNEILLLKVNI
jgi:hypothetical protein